jgi:hypothetical protein
MRGCARKTLVWLALSAGAALAGCSSLDANGWLAAGKLPIQANAASQEAPEATHSIAPDTKSSEKKKPARKPQHLTVAPPKPPSAAPAQTVQPPATEPKPASAQSPAPELRLRTLWPDAPASGTFSR